MLLEPQRGEEYHIIMQLTNRQVERTPEVLSNFGQIVLFRQLNNNRK